MKIGITAGFVVAGVCAFVLLASRPAQSGEGAAEDAPRYVGDKACLKCHFQQSKSWKKTGMAKAMRTLLPTLETEDKALFDRKKAAKLDPAKDYTTDAKCLPCHTTGYGKPGGYPEDAKKDEESVKAAAVMGNVSCEACHGPGSAYVKMKTAAIEKDKDAKFTWDELAKFGLTKPNEANCAQCHNKDAPTQPAEPFKFEDAKAKVHDHPKK